MTRKIWIVLGLSVAFVSFLYVPEAQTQEKEWKKTVTLPNGEVILDISGEWDAFLEDRPPGSPYRSETGVTKITQTGGSFEGIVLTSLRAFRNSTEQIKGELDKNGFKKVQVISSYFGVSEAKGQISEDGSMIVLHVGKWFKLTLIRK